MTGYCIYQNYFLPLSQQLKIIVMEISYICPCDKQTLRLLLMTAKDNVKEYNDIIDIQNKLCNEVYNRNILLAKTLLGNNKQMAIKPTDLNVWVYDGDTEKHFVEVKQIRCTQDDEEIVKIEFITQQSVVNVNDLELDVCIDLNSILECCVEELFNKVSK